jgi:hypothetical protein
MTGGWRKLHNEELHGLYFLPNIILLVKSRRMNWAGHLTPLGRMRIAYKILAGMSEGKRLLGSSNHKWEDNEGLHK